MRTDLDKLCEEKDVKIVAVYTGDEQRWEGKPQHHYRITLEYQGRKLHTDFWQGSGHKAPDKPGRIPPGMPFGPSAADVLSCLCSDARSGENARDFADFVNEFGYELKTAKDIRDAQRTYNACVDMAPRVRALLGADFDLFANAEH